eukprot:SM000009S23526  [mRNA]  locus=s9:580204:583567:- [translate_table: standard]
MISRRPLLAARTLRRGSPAGSCLLLAAKVSFLAAAFSQSPQWLPAAPTAAAAAAGDADRLLRVALPARPAPAAVAARRVVRKAPRAGAEAPPTTASPLPDGADFSGDKLPTLSGYVPVAAGSASRLFYTFYEASDPGGRPLRDTPLILWLNGGPGCSSLIGAFYELGPWRVAGVDGRLVPNAGAWNRRYGVLFVDNPIGTGFSVVGPSETAPTDQARVAEHLLHGLLAFFGENPDFAGRPLVVAGESYGGKYVPSLAHRLLEEVRRGASGGGSAKEPRLPFRLLGMAVGNGFTDPRSQGPPVGTPADAVCSRPSDGRSREEWVAAHHRRTRLCEWIEEHGGIPTLLDVRRYAKYHATEDGIEYLALFLNRPEVKAALGADADVDWVSCRKSIRLHMAEDTMKSCKWKVEACVRAGLPMLLYQGQYDAKDGVVSSLAWMADLDWDRNDAFWGAERRLWRVDGRLAGYWRQLDNLTHVEVTGAGHQVPVDQPRHSQVMIENWIEAQLDSMVVAGAKLEAAVAVGSG